MTPCRPCRLIPILLTVLAVGLWQGRLEAQGAYPKLILIIRHAEKTGSKDDIHLSDAGKERAKQLPRLFEKASKRPDPLPIPDFIFAARDSKNSQRPRETVEHLASTFKLPVNFDYHSTAPAKDSKAKGAAELRDELFTNPKYAGKTILICWRHGVLPELARTLKATNAPTKWGDDVYDRVWKITYDHAGKATFVDAPQRLMPGDAVK